MTQSVSNQNTATGTSFKLICNSLYNDFMTQHSQIKSKSMLNTSSYNLENHNFSIRSVIPPLYACKVDLLNYKIYLASAFSCEIDELPNFIFCLECVYGFSSPTIIISFLELDCFLNKKTMNIDPKYEAMKRAKRACDIFSKCPEFDCSQVVIETSSTDNSNKDVISVDDSSSGDCSEDTEKKPKSKTSELKRFIHECVTPSNEDDMKVDLRIVYLIYRQWANDVNKRRKKSYEPGYNDFDDFAEEFDYLLKSNKGFKCYSLLQSKNYTTCKGIYISATNIPGFVYGKLEKKKDNTHKPGTRRKLYR